MCMPCAYVRVRLQTVASLHVVAAFDAARESSSTALAARVARFDSSCNRVAVDAANAKAATALEAALWSLFALTLVGHMHNMTAVTRSTTLYQLGAVPLSRHLCRAFGMYNRCTSSRHTASLLPCSGLRVS